MQHSVHPLKEPYLEGPLEAVYRQRADVEDELSAADLGRCGERIQPRARTRA